MKNTIERMCKQKQEGKKIADESKYINRTIIITDFIRRTITQKCGTQKQFGETNIGAT